MEQEQAAVLLTTQELSAWLNIKPSTLRKWVCRKKIPYLKIGGSVRFRKTDIDYWLNLNKSSSEKERTIGELDRYNVGRR